jgi:hypothetical protein
LRAGNKNAFLRLWLGGRIETRSSRFFFVL